VAGADVDGRGLGYAPIGTPTADSFLPLHAVTPYSRHRLAAAIVEIGREGVRPHEGVGLRIGSGFAPFDTLTPGSY
jgi:hypothetical protein